MKFVIRDDDLNYYSTPEDIERWYADLFAEGIPVGFSAIPFVKPVSDVYTKDIPQSDEEHPIHENAELAAYVATQPLMEILQHGTTHETVGSKFEYALPVALEETLRGRAELERAFNRPVRIFVPPHDWIGSSGILSVEHAGMNIIRGRGAGLRNLIFRWSYLKNFLHMLAYKGWYALRGKVPAYPHVLDFGKHKEMCSYRLEDTDVLKGLQHARRTGGDFVVVTHLHYYTPEKKDLLWQLIRRGRELGAKFVPPSALFHDP